MVDGDGNPPAGGGSPPQDPTDTGPNFNTAARGGMSGFGENWGSGTATFDEVFENVQAVFESMKGELLKAWLALVAVMFLLETVEVAIHAFAEITGVLEGVVALLAIPVSILISLVYFGVTAAQLSLYGPLRDRVFHGIEPDGWLRALQTGSGRILPVLGTLVALALVIPCGCVIPGLVLAFFGVMAPYIVATEEIGIVDGFKKSYERAKQYWEIFAVTIGALLAVGFVLACCSGVGGFIQNAAPEPFGFVVQQYAIWVGMVLFQFGVFVVWGGVFVTVDANESGQTLRR